VGSLLEDMAQLRLKSYDGKRLLSPTL
jgi:hypothetical protein